MEAFAPRMTHASKNASRFLESFDIESSDPYTMSVCVVKKKLFVEQNIFIFDCIHLFPSIFSLFFSLKKCHGSNFLFLFFSDPGINCPKRYQAKKFSWRFQFSRKRWKWAAGGWCPCHLSSGSQLVKIAWFEECYGAIGGVRKGKRRNLESVQSFTTQRMQVSRAWDEVVGADGKLGCSFSVLFSEAEIYMLYVEYFARSFFFAYEIIVLLPCFRFRFCPISSLEKKKKEKLLRLSWWLSSFLFRSVLSYFPCFVSVFHVLFCLFFFAIFWVCLLSIRYSCFLFSWLSSWPLIAGTTQCARYPRYPWASRSAYLIDPTSFARSVFPSGLMSSHVHLPGSPATASQVTGCDVTPDEKRVVTCSFDRTVKVWDSYDELLTSRYKQ